MTTGKHGAALLCHHHRMAMAARHRHRESLRRPKGGKALVNRRRMPLRAPEANVYEDGLSMSQGSDLSMMPDSVLVHHMQSCVNSEQVLIALQCLLRRSSSAEWGGSTAVVDEMFRVSKTWPSSSASLLALKILTNISSSTSYSILTFPGHISSLLATLHNGDSLCEGLLVSLVASLGHPQNTYS